MATKSDQQDVVLLAEIEECLGIDQLKKTLKNCQVESRAVTSLSRSSVFSLINDIEGMYLALFEE